MISANAHRNTAPSVTVGSMPSDDPLYPKVDTSTTSRMNWPTYGEMPNLGSLGRDLSTERAASLAHAPHTTVTPANAAAQGQSADFGLVPVEPLQLNPTTSVSGLFDQMHRLGGTAGQLGAVLAEWESTARMPDGVIIFAVGPHLVAEGMGDVVVDLLARGLISALILEGNAVLDDCFASLGFRHYLGYPPSEPASERREQERSAAHTALIETLARSNISGGSDIRRLGSALHDSAPHPGMIATAIGHDVPVAVVGETGLNDLGLNSSSQSVNLAPLHALSAASTLILAFGTTVAVSQCVASFGVDILSIAI